MHEHDLDVPRVQIAEKLARRLEEIVHGGGGFRPGKAAARDDEGQHSGTRFSQGLTIGLRQELDHPIAQANGVAQGLHSQRIFFQPRQMVEIGDAAKSDHQVVIGNVERAGVVQPLGNGHALVVESDGPDGSLEEMDMAEELPGGDDDMR